MQELEFESTFFQTIKSVKDEKTETKERKNFGYVKIISLHSYFSNCVFTVYGKTIKYIKNPYDFPKKP